MTNSDRPVVDEAEPVPGDGTVDSERGHWIWLGAAGEHLVAATIALAGKGQVNIGQTLWDAEGIDLYLDGPAPSSTRMLLQVKSVSSDSSYVKTHGIARARVRDQTFQVRDDVWVLVIVLDTEALTFEKAWLVPAKDFAAKTEVDGSGYRWFRDRLASTRSIWTQYRTESRKALTAEILRVLQA